MAPRRSVSTSRVIAADRAAVFDLVADPSMHPVIDGSGTVTAVHGEQVARLAYGTEFGMAVHRGARYRVLNTVVEFVEGDRVAWRHFHGHRWRYEFDDDPGGVRVTETFDWSGAKFKLALELAGFPRANLQAMRATLRRLEALAVTGR